MWSSGQLTGNGFPAGDIAATIPRCMGT